MPTSKTKVKRKSATSNTVRSTRLFKAHARSRITNGASILENVDGRTFWVRRYRDITALLLSDQGGDQHVSEARKMLVRRAACLAVELEASFAFTASRRRSACGLGPLSPTTGPSREVALRQPF